MIWAIIYCTIASHLRAAGLLELTEYLDEQKRLVTISTDYGIYGHFAVVVESLEGIKGICEQNGYDINLPQTYIEKNQIQDNADTGSERCRNRNNRRIRIPMEGENMGNDEKVKLLVNISRLYYEHNYSQQMIAEKLNISRPYVSKLINEAKERGIVEIRIFDPYESETQIEIDLKNRFGLNRAIIVPSVKESDVVGSIGKAAARYLDTVIKDNDIIGVAWGTTLYSFSEQIIKREDLKNITVVQLCGGISNIEKNIYANEIPKKIADAYKGKPYIIPLPAVLNSINVTDAVVKEKNIKSVLELANRANIAVFTMGPFGYEGALSRAGYLDSDDVDKLVRKGAVGDICTRIINEEGNICDNDLNRRTIAVELTELKKKEQRIGIAAGLNRIKCIYAALKAGYANVLVTDEATAAELSKMD